MPHLLGLLVGAHFRPPAKQILQVLPGECPLELRPEPDNPYDPEAMAVYLATSTLEVAVGPQTPRRAALEDALPSCGWTLQALLEQPEVQLGYLARAGNRDLGKLQGVAPANAFKGGDATLKWGANGEALIQQEHQ